MKNFIFFLKTVLLINLCACNSSDNISDINPDNLGESVSDIDGNTYQTVVIGNQIWMGENLKTTKYNDGTDILTLETNDEWEYVSDNGIGAYCWYDNDISNKNAYGALYNWYALDNNGMKNICPEGWSVPANDDWNELRLFLDSNGTSTDNIAGGLLKHTSTTFWNTPNTGATNSSGFSVLPNGDRSASTGSFGDKGRTANIWTSTEDFDRANWIQLGSSTETMLFPKTKKKGMGFCIRCIKN